MYFMNDVDFEQFIKLLDAALASDDKKIQKALRKFMFIMALNISDDECEPGPFTKMMETMDELQRRLAAIESKDNTFTTTDPYTQTWPYGVGIGTAAPYTTPPSTTGGSATSTGTVQWTNAPSASSNTVNITGNTTTTTANTLLGGSNCWTNTGTYIINSDEDSGTAIKDEIKEKLAKLVNAA